MEDVSIVLIICIHEVHKATNIGVQSLPCCSSWVPRTSLTSSSAEKRRCDLVQARPSKANAHRRRHRTDPMDRRGRFWGTKHGETGDQPWDVGMIMACFFKEITRKAGYFFYPHVVKLAVWRVNRRHMDGW